MPQLKTSNYQLKAGWYLPIVPKNEAVLCETLREDSTRHVAFEGLAQSTPDQRCQVPG